MGSYNFSHPIQPVLYMPADKRGSKPAPVVLRNTTWVYNIVQFRDAFGEHEVNGGGLVWVPFFPWVFPFHYSEEPMGQLRVEFPLVVLQEVFP